MIARRTWVSTALYCLLWTLVLGGWTVIVLEWSKQ